MNEDEQRKFRIALCKIQDSTMAISNVLFDEAKNNNGIKRFGFIKIAQDLKSISGRAGDLSNILAEKNE